MEIHSRPRCITRPRVACIPLGRTCDEIFQGCGVFSRNPIVPAVLGIIRDGEGRVTSKSIVTAGDSVDERLAEIQSRRNWIQAMASGHLNRSGEAEVVIERFDRAVSVGGAGDQATAGGDFFADEGDGIGRAGGHAGVGGV